MEHKIPVGRHGKTYPSSSPGLRKRVFPRMTSRPYRTMSWRGLRAPRSISRPRALRPRKCSPIREICAGPGASLARRSLPAPHVARPTNSSPYPRKEAWFGSSIWASSKLTVRWPPSANGQRFAVPTFRWGSGRITAGQAGRPGSWPRVRRSAPDSECPPQLRRGRELFLRLLRRYTFWLGRVGAFARGRVAGGQVRSECPVVSGAGYGSSSPCAPNCNNPAAAANPQVPPPTTSAGATAVPGTSSQLIGQCFSGSPPTPRPATAVTRLPSLPKLEKDWTAPYRWRSLSTRCGSITQFPLLSFSIYPRISRTNRCSPRSKVRGISCLQPD